MDHFLDIQRNNNGVVDSVSISFSDCCNNSDSDKLQQDCINDEQLLQFDNETQFHRHFSPVPIRQFKHPYPSNTIVPDGYGKFVPKNVISYSQPTNQLLPPMHNFNQRMAVPMGKQFTVKRQPVSFRPQPIVKGLYNMVNGLEALPMAGPMPVAGQPMVKAYMLNRPEQPVLLQQPLHMKVSPQNLPSVLTKETKFDMRHAYKSFEPNKRSILVERANQCALLYLAVKNRNVLSFLGLEANKKPPPPNVTGLRFEEHDLPYTEIKTDNLWRYIEAWRGNMFELNHKMANDGYKVAISPSTLTLLGSIIEMKLIDLLSELVKAAEGSNIITMEHLRTCIQKSSLDIAPSSVRKIENIYAKITGHY